MLNAVLLDAAVFNGLNARLASRLTASGASFNALSIACSSSCSSLSIECLLILSKLYWLFHPQVTSLSSAQSNAHRSLWVCFLRSYSLRPQWLRSPMILEPASSVICSPAFCSWLSSMLASLIPLVLYVLSLSSFSKK